MFSHRLVRVPMIVASLGCVVLLGACGSDSNSSDTTVAAVETSAPAAAESTMAATESTMATTMGATETTMASGAMADTTMAGSDSSMMAAALTPFGPACSSVPADGAGSFAGMAKDPAATAASNNPALSTLVAAVTAAGLGDTLNGPGPFTIFAPANDAFAKIDKATLDTLLADPKGDLTKILTYHVIAGKALSAADLLKDAQETTVQGGMVKVSGTSTDVMVNGSAKVVCGDVQVGNGVVHIIDSVLMPG